MKKDKVIIKKSNNITQKSVTVRPDKKNQLFTQKQIKDYVSKQIAKLPKEAKVIVTGKNVLRETTLKGYTGDFMTDEQFDTYLKGKVKDVTKFKYFTDFTVTIVTENNLFGF